VHLVHLLHEFDLIFLRLRLVHPPEMFFVVRVHLITERFVLLKIETSVLDIQLIGSGCVLELIPQLLHFVPLELFIPLALLKVIQPLGLLLGSRFVLPVLVLLLAQYFYLFLQFGFVFHPLFAEFLMVQMDVPVELSDVVSHFYAGDACVGLDVPVDLLDEFIRVFTGAALAGFFISLQFLLVLQGFDGQDLVT
jgi:hypothetical protein